jgi:hypothetical protein
MAWHLPDDYWSNAAACSSTANAPGFRLTSQMRSVSSIRIVRITLSLAVALWMAGAGCILGCENIVNAAASSQSLRSGDDSATIVADEACASMHAHDCCSRRSAKLAQGAATTLGREFSNPLDSAVIPAELGATSTMRDCPLAVNATAALAKAGQDQLTTALQSSGAGAFGSNTDEQTAAFARPLRPPNRGHTYLRCCVFLI